MKLLSYAWLMLEQQVICYNLYLHFVLVAISSHPHPSLQEGGQGLSNPLAQRQLAYPGPELEAAYRKSPGFYESVSSLVADAR